MFQLNGIPEQDMNNVRNQRGNNDQILSNFASLFRLDSSSRIIPTLQSPKLVGSQILMKFIYFISYYLVIGLFIFTHMSVGSTSTKDLVY